MLLIFCWCLSDCSIFSFAVCQVAFIFSLYVYQVASYFLLRFVKLLFIFGLCLSSCFLFFVEVCQVVPYFWLMCIKFLLIFGWGLSSCFLFFVDVFLSCFKFLVHCCQIVSTFWLKIKWYFVDRKHRVAGAADAEEGGPREVPEVWGGPPRPRHRHGHQDIPRHSM